MDGPSIKNISNITSEIPKHLLQQLMESNCVTWHPYFEQRHYDRIMNIVHTQVPYENLTKDNKWGYQFHISRDLEKIPVDYNDIISVKNMIVMDHFTVSIDDNNEYHYSCRNPLSILEVFLKYCTKYKKDRDEWNHDDVKELKQIHDIIKKKYCQYTFFTINEKELDYFANSIIHLATN